MVQIVLDYRATETFLIAYEAVPAYDIEVVDAALRTILGFPNSAEARRKRVEGDVGGAWVATAHGRDHDWSIYWQQTDADTVHLLLLLPH